MSRVVVGYCVRCRGPLFAEDETKPARARGGMTKVGNVQVGNATKPMGSRHKVCPPEYMRFARIRSDSVNRSRQKQDNAFRQARLRSLTEEPKT